jgi:hypothetical protein
VTIILDENILRQLVPVYGDLVERVWRTWYLEDAVACVFCSRFGIDAIEASSDYILNWKGDKQALLNRLKRIRHCSAGIITDMEKLTGKSVVFPI